MNIKVPSPGSPDESHRQQLSLEQKRREAQRVKEVEAVDADEQAKRWRNAFQQAQDQNETEDNAPAAQSQPSPSIFDTSFNSTTKSGISTDAAIPSPGYSPAPNLWGLEPESEDFLSSSDLPQSESFYEGYNLPDEPLETPQYQQQTAPEQSYQPQQPTEEHSPEPMKGKPPSKGSEPGKQTTAQKKEVKAEIPPKGLPRGPAALPPKKEQKLEPSPFGPPGKPVTAKEGKAPKKKEEPEVSPGKYWAGGEEMPQLPQKPSTTTAKEKERLPLPKTEAAPPQKAPMAKKPPPKPFEPTLEKVEGRPSGEKEEGRQGRERGGKPVEIISPSLPNLPTDVQPMAQSAAVNAAPYLRPEMLPIFYQMMGNILIMSSPKGITHTEFLLNNPAFSNSKFYGSSIEITRYSTAPDSFNIRLSGSNEAVDAFNQNIPSLMAAFHTGGHKFRVGRIDTEYRTERPIVKRKESGREKEEKQ